MTVYAGYEVVKELSRRGETVAALARPEGTSEKACFVVKVFCAFSPFADHEARERETESFLAGCRAQQQAASGGARHWAPVLEAGRTDGEEAEAFFVTRHYPRSLEKLVVGRVKLNGACLHAIMMSVLRGLQELDAACGRAHGNLKPTNVLLGPNTNIARARIVLTDPAGVPPAGGSAGEAEDLRALGRLLYALVTHRSCGKGVSSVAEGPEWDRLGSRGADWRQLCSRLIDPGSKPNREGVAAVLRGLDESRGKALKRVAVAGVLVGLCACVGACFHPAVRQHRVFQGVVRKVRSVPDMAVGLVGRVRNVGGRAVWDQLCEEYRGWFGALYGGLGNERRARWGRDAYLKRFIENLDAAHESGIEFDPRRIADAATSHLDYIVDHPPKSIRRGEVIEQMQAALAAMQSAKVALRDDWPWPTEVTAVAATYRERGWGRPAGYLASLVAAVRVEPPGRVVPVVDQLVALRDQLPEVEKRWAALRRLHTASQGLERDGFERAMESILSPAGEGSLEDMSVLMARLARQGEPDSRTATAPPPPEEVRPRDPEGEDATGRPPVATAAASADANAHGADDTDVLGVTGSDALAACWRRQSGELAGDTGGRAALWAFLEQIDWTLPVNPRLVGEGDSKQWDEQTLSLTWDRREQALTGLLGAIAWSHGTPPMSFKELVRSPLWQEHVSQYERWRTELGGPNTR